MLLLLMLSPSSSHESNCDCLLWSAAFKSPRPDVRSDSIRDPPKPERPESKTHGYPVRDCRSILKRTFGRARLWLLNSSASEKAVNNKIRPYTDTFEYTVCIRDSNWALAKDATLLLLCYFWPLLAWASIFGVAMTTIIKLGFSKFLIHTVVFVQIKGAIMFFCLQWYPWDFV